MNNYHVALTVQELLNECIDQVALDFRSVRATGGEAADKIYDDYTLTTDEKMPFAVEFQSAAAELCAQHTSAVRCCMLTEDRFAADVAILRTLPQQIVERMLKDYMKARMLAWWYRLRNTDLWQKHLLQAQSVSDRLQSLFSPSCTTRRLRYF